ncbi:hypothetical protein THAOC_29030, partial [Thalassiosira oceanica]
MKFPVLFPALFASSIASASAADINGYTGSDYTFVGVGHCLQAIPEGRSATLHYSLAAIYNNQLLGLGLSSSPQAGPDPSEWSPRSEDRRRDGGFLSVAKKIFRARSPWTNAPHTVSRLAASMVKLVLIQMQAIACADTPMDLVPSALPPRKDYHGIPTHGGDWSHNAATLPAPFTMDECAAYCLGFPNTEGLVAMEGRIGDCLCRYTDGTGPESATSEAGLSYNSDASGPVGGTTGSTVAICWTYNWAFGNPTKSPSKAPTGSPHVPTTSPTKSPAGSPSQGPSQGPSTSVVATAGGAAIPEDSLYYPDWSKSDGGCKTGGGQPHI